MSNLCVSLIVEAPLPDEWKQMSEAELEERALKMFREVARHDPNIRVDDWWVT